MTTALQAGRETIQIKRVLFKYRDEHAWQLELREISDEEVSDEIFMSFHGSNPNYLKALMELNAARDQNEQMFRALGFSVISNLDLSQFDVTLGEK